MQFLCEYLSLLSLCAQKLLLTSLQAKTVIALCNLFTGIDVPYSLPSVGPGADPGV